MINLDWFDRFMEKSWSVEVFVVIVVIVGILFASLLAWAL
jgi:hypothetical protein